MVANHESPSWRFHSIRSWTQPCTNTVPCVILFPKNKRIVGWNNFVFNCIHWCHEQFCLHSHYQISSRNITSKAKCCSVTCHVLFSMTVLRNVRNSGLLNTMCWWPWIQHTAATQVGRYSACAWRMRAVEMKCNSRFVLLQGCQIIRHTETLLIWQSVATREANR